MIVAALAAAVAASACTPVAGAGRLWQKPGTRYVMVGETHGTREAPDLFADLVCTAGKSKRVIVALEQPPTDQSAIDIFLRSSGGAEALRSFLRADMWNGKFRDGRSSEAMLGLFERLRQLKQSGRIHGVVAFQDYDLAVPFSNANEGINRGMAAALKRVAAANPGALVLAYGGSVHMSHDDVPGTAIPSAAGRLPRSETVTVLVDGEAGTAWNCSDSECRGGVHEVLSMTTVCKPRVRAVVFPAQSTVAPGFDAVACVGRPFRASPPAVPLTPN